MKKLPLKRNPTEDFCKCLEHIKPILLDTSGDLNFIPQFFTVSSHECKPGCVFVAVKGAKHDGHNHILQAVQKGARGVVCENEEACKALPKEQIAIAKVSNSRAAHSFLQEIFYGIPASALKLVGITGTNGKTTCTYLLKAFLSSEANCGMISTVEYTMPGWSTDAARTTPSPELFQAMLFNMAQRECKYVVMELSSHGLDQNRTASAKFSGAIFTNLTGDHLDYHGSMENYYQAKKKLFSDCLANDAVAVVNADDPWGRRIISEIPEREIFSCGFSQDSDFQICDFRGNSNGISFSLKCKDGRFKLKSNLCGKYNAMNVAEAFIIGFKLGIKEEKMTAILAEGIRVPGRLEKLNLKNGAIAFVDYAHTDDALEKVLSTLTPIKKRKLICVFGCGGDRDRSKRQRMGAVAAKFADFIIVTSDNPRTEDPLAIIKEILSGIPPHTHFESIPDRREAIRKAVEISREGDIILVAGKGHEKGQEIAGRIFPFDDREELLNFC